jgi:hypothetical protein
MDKTFLSKILNYENEIFNKFIQTRTNLIKNLNGLKENEEFNFNQRQLINFVNSLKGVTDSLKSVNNQIDEYFVNYDLDFNRQTDLQDNNFIIFYFLFKDLFFSKIGSSEESEQVSSSESVSESVSSSDSVSSEVSE